MLVDAIGRVEGSLSDSTLRSLTPELRSSIASIVQRVSETLNLQPAAAHDVILDAVGIAKLQASRQDRRGEMHASAKLHSQALTSYVESWARPGHR